MTKQKVQTLKLCQNTGKQNCVCFQEKQCFSTMCFSSIFLLFFFSFFPLVFNLWQLLFSHSWDFLDQKHLHACLKKVQQENSEILGRASEPHWTWIKRADCNWLCDTAVRVGQTAHVASPRERRAPAAAYREPLCKRNLQRSPEKLRWIIAALPCNVCQIRST